MFKRQAIFNPECEPHEPRTGKQWIKAMNSNDPEVRMAAMAGLQTIVHEDAIILPMYEQGVIYLQHPKIKGMRRTVVGSDPDFTYARIVP